MFRDDVESFILEHIHSIEQLEVLVLIKSDPLRSWGAEEISRRLCTHLEAATQRLQEFEHAGVLKRLETVPPTYQYHPDSPERADTMSQLEADYKKRRASVISFIYSRARSSAYEFSRAFKISKDKK